MLSECFVALKARLADLHASFRLGGGSLSERTQQAYKDKVISGLSSLFEEQYETSILDELTLFFKTNWELVQGSSLSYTALPQDELTEFLCDLACWVSDCRNEGDSDASVPCNGLAILMPGLCLESVNEDIAPSLAPVWLEEERRWIQPDIQKVLRTHILGRDSQYLLPVLMLGSAIEKWENQNRIFNPYYDFSSHPEAYAEITLEEFDRLKGHSVSTQAVIDAWKEYAHYRDDESHLLGQLYNLRRHLHVYDAHGGMGSQESAGFGAYNAILEFSQYYESLVLEDKARIPTPVKAEIDLLLHLSSEERGQMSEQRNLQTCIGTRGETLERLISQQENSVILQTIRVSEDSKVSLMEAAKAKFERNLSILEHQIREGTYTGGRDFLPLRCSVLQDLEAQVRIDSLEDLSSFLTLTQEEILEMCKLPEITRQIRTQIDSLETLVMYCHDTPDAQLEALFMILVNDSGRPDCIRNIIDLQALLISLSPGKIHIVLRSLQESLSDFLSRGSSLRSVLHYLTPEQCRAVCESLKYVFWPRLTDRGKYSDVCFFEEMCDGLTLEKFRAVCESFKEKLGEMISCAISFAYRLKELTPEKRTILYESIENVEYFLSGLIKTKYDFKGVLLYLTPMQCSAVCERFKHRFGEIFQNAEDFGFAWCPFNAEQCRAICESLKDKIEGLILNTESFRALLNDRKPDQCRAICESLKYLASRVIRHAQDIHMLWNVSIFYDRDYCRATYESLKEILDPIIKRPSDVRTIFQYLYPRDRLTFCTIFEGHPVVSRYARNNYGFFAGGEDQFPNGLPDKESSSCNCVVL